MQRRWSTTRSVDLAVVAALALVAALAARFDAAAWLRVPLGLAFVLGLPGYAFIAALFPERFREPVGDVGRRGLEPLERVALSLGLSIAIVPLLGLALNYTPWGIRLQPILLVVGGFTLACCAVAWRRRLRLPIDERLELVVRIEGEPWAQRSGVDRRLSIALVLAVVFAAGSLVYVLVTPRSGEAFTELYILGPTGKAACYPAAYRGSAYTVTAADIEAGCPAVVTNITVGIVNHEHQPTTYWLRVLWTKETRLPDNTTRVDVVQQVSLRQVRLDDVPVDLSLNATFKPQYESAITLPPPPYSGQQRLSFQLYLQEPPTPSTTDPHLLDGAYRRTHVFVEK